MKTVNADYGIDSVPAEAEKRTWYRWHRFPLLPICEYRAADDWNEANVSFSWLNIRAWSLMTPGLTVELDLDDKGLTLRLAVPYFQFIIWLLPFPIAFQRWSYDRLWRKGRKTKDG